MRLFTPDSTLHPYIECYWSWQFEPTAPELDPILPDAAPEFIVHLGVVPESLQPSGIWKRQLSSFLYCAAHRSVRLRSEAPIDLFAVRFRPWGVSRFSDESMADLLDRPIPPAEVFGPMGDTLADAIGSAGDDATRVQGVDRILRDALREPDPRKDRLAALLNAVDGGRSSGRDIARALDLSERSFRRLWRDVVGIESRKFKALMRFHRAISKIDAGEDLASVAADCGYSDQPHLGREIKAISGLPPSLLRRRLGADVFQVLYANRPEAPWRH